MAIFDHSIDKNTPVPLYYQLKTILVKEIESGNYRPGDSIPTEKELVEMYDVSRTTVRQAISELVQEGRLRRVKSKGTFVTQPKIKQNFIKKLESFNEQIRRMGCTPSTRVLEFGKIVVPDSYAVAMGLDFGDEVAYLRRLRFINQEPNVVVATYLPLDRCGFVLKHNFATESLYNVLALRPDTCICKVNRIAEAIAATTEDAQLLGVKVGQPIHSFVTTGYNANNQIVEYSLAHYRGDRNRFETEIFVDTSV